MEIHPASRFRTLTAVNAAAGGRAQGEGRQDPPKMEQPRPKPEDSARKPRPEVVDAEFSEVPLPYPAGFVAQLFGQVMMKPNPAQARAIYAQAQRPAPRPGLLTTLSA
jgi:hypothetical protein